jgi:hypothetical protein
VSLSKSRLFLTNVPQLADRRGFIPWNLGNIDVGIEKQEADQKRQ